MYFALLQHRLIALVRGRLQNGEFTERRLARLTGVSQPHMHNILKGVRVLSPGLADEILRQLNITLVDLLYPAELDHRPAGSAAEQKPAGRGHRSGPPPDKSPEPGSQYSPN